MAVITGLSNVYEFCLVPTTAEMVTTMFPFSPNVPFGLGKHEMDVADTQAWLVQKDTPSRTVGLSAAFPKLTPVNVTLNPAEVGKLYSLMKDTTGASYVRIAAEVPTTLETVRTG